MINVEREDGYDEGDREGLGCEKRKEQEQEQEQEQEGGPHITHTTQTRQRIHSHLDLQRGRCEEDGAARPHRRYRQPAPHTPARLDLRALASLRYISFLCEKTPDTT
jgi:hypothetical protein